MLSVHELIKRFGSVTALDNVSCDIPAGTIHGLIGPIRSGKTTFFNCVTGFLKPAAGRVTWKGEQISQDPATIRAYLGEETI